MKHIVIIGGGISGLSSAFYLSKSSRVKITVIDKSNLIGGWIRSSSYKDSLILESGPRTIRTYGSTATNTLKLIEDIGLEKVISGVKSSDPSVSNRYVYYNKTLHQLPRSILSLFQKNTLTTKALAYYILKEPFVSLKQAKKCNLKQDQSIYHFMSSRLGLEIADLLIDPLCKGIFAGDSKLLSIKSCFPNIFKSIDNHGSIVIGNLLSSYSNKQENNPKLDNKLINKSKQQKWTMWYIKEGLECFPNAILDHLLNNHKSYFQIIKEESCASLDFLPESKIKVKTTKRDIYCDHVFAALPSHELSRILENAAGPQDEIPQGIQSIPKQVYRNLARELSRINSIDVAVVNLVYRLENRSEMSSLPRGFGYLVPSKQDTPLLGTIFDWSIYGSSGPEDAPFPRLINLTCMIGGAWMEHYFGEVDGGNEAIFLECAIKSVREHLKITSDPVHYKVAYNKKCIPQYAVGHYKVVENLESMIQSNDLPLTLVGASYNGVSINDCIYNSKIACERLLNKMQL